MLEMARLIADRQSLRVEIVPNLLPLIRILDRERFIRADIPSSN
jgi:hypothetical protein